MIKKLIITTAQLNFTVGDLEGNREKILLAHKEAHKEKADLVIFSEMSVTGYPPEDLVLRPHFQDKSIDIIHELAKETGNGTAMLVGSLWREGTSIYNAAILLDKGKIASVTCKYNLPNYGVFDEKRIFSVPPKPSPIEFRGVKLGIMVCEDMWNFDTAKSLKKQGARLLISINASPFESDKHNLRIDIARKNLEATKLPLIYLNQIGGQDELVFDGGSFIMSDKGEIIFRQPQWEESVKTTEWQLKKNKWVMQSDTSLPETEENRLQTIYSALKLGLRDYVTKNGFKGVVLGMSGGIDSAITAAIAVDALGADKVHLVMMPSKYTSRVSIEDAKQCARLLDVKLDEIPIKKLVGSFTKTMKPFFKNTKPDITEENIQSRIRGNILMALSNKFGYMVLTTGNKSEMAVGYATLYGDMCGGYNVLKDVYKTDVFALTKWRNEIVEVIPHNIIIKPPTAELRPGQRDDDTLPPYDVLDDILIHLIEMRHSSRQVAEHGHPIKVVERVARLVKLSEYKRFQSPPGVKITRLAFGRDRRYPITNLFDF